MKSIIGILFVIFTRSTNNYYFIYWILERIVFFLFFAQLHRKTIRFATNGATATNNHSISLTFGINTSEFHSIWIWRRNNWIDFDEGGIERAMRRMWRAETRKKFSLCDVQPRHFWYSLFSLYIWLHVDHLLFMTLDLIQWKCTLAVEMMMVKRTTFEKKAEKKKKMEI